MQTIEIQYRPLQLPWKRKVTGKFPESFSDLTGNQLRAVAAIAKNTITETRFLSCMTGIPSRIINQLSQFHRFNLFSMFTFFDDIKPHNAFIINTISCKNKILVSPAAKLKGVTFGQFIFADMLFETYSESKSPADLHKFVAALYLPENTPFSEDIINANAATIVEVTPEIPDAIAINYQLVREWLCNVYPLIFPQADEPTNSSVSPHDSTSSNVPLAKGDERSGGGKGRANSNAWIKIFEGIMGDDIVNHDKYAQMPVHNIFRYMSQKIKENMKRK